MTALFVLDVPENEGIVRVAGQDALLVVDKIGPYFRIALGAGDARPPQGAGPGRDADMDAGPGEASRDGQIVIDRRACGCRHAVWYSAVAGLQDARIAQHDKNALRIVPGREGRP